jgi:hypothetical protein
LGACCASTGLDDISNSAIAVTMVFPIEVLREGLALIVFSSPFGCVTIRVVL